MSARDEEQLREERAENRAFWVGFSLAMLIGCAALNVFVLLFIVPKFEQIFADALPVMPLPGITNFVIGYRFALVFVAAVWPVVCILMRKGEKLYAIVLINIGIIYFILELGSTIIALFMPMVGGPIVGMSDAGGH